MALEYKVDERRNIRVGPYNEFWTDGEIHPAVIRHHNNSTQWRNSQSVWKINDYEQNEKELHMIINTTTSTEYAKYITENEQNVFETERARRALVFYLSFF